jgi:hypothetical protein
MTLIMLRTYCGCGLVGDNGTGRGEGGTSGPCRGDEADSCVAVAEKLPSYARPFGFAQGKLVEGNCPYMNPPACPKSAFPFGGGFSLFSANSSAFCGLR